MAEAGTALIVGASRGLGLELVREYLRRGWSVTASERGRSDALHALADEAEGRLRVVQVDVADDKSVAALLRTLEGVRFDLVFVNAGVGSPTDLLEVGAEVDVRIMHANAVGPARLARLFLPRVTPGTGVIAFMSSTMGSIEEDTAGGWDSYRASKAALNAYARALAVRHAQPEGVTVLSFNPGWVRTDLGGPHATLEAEETVPRLADMVAARVGSGRHEFLDYDGRTVPW